jgi:hypothetical protein
MSARDSFIAPVLLRWFYVVEMGTRPATARTPKRTFCQLIHRSESHKLCILLAYPTL